MNTVAVNSKRLKLSKQLASELVDCSASELKALANRQRHFACEHIATSYEALDDQWQSLSTALVIEATRRTLGFSLFDTQIEAGLIVAGNRVCEMQTGEGKTLAMAIPAASRALEGRGVHVAVPNEYLAKRDYDFLRPMFAAVDLTSGVLQTGMDEASTRNAYAQDITYGPGYRFAFDYLRDELAVERSRVERATQGRRFQFTPGCDSPRRLQRGLHAAIIDEIDHVLLDDAMSPLVISHGVQGDALDADWIRAANQCAEHLVVNQDYQIDAKNRIRLAHRGISQVYTLQPATIECELVRPWHEYVTLALRAQHTLHRDRNYTILDERICIIDQSTGRLHQDRTWSGGLHQAVEAKECLSIRHVNKEDAKISRQRFFRMYSNLGGCTGTATDCEREFQFLFRLPVLTVEPRLPSKRLRLPMYVCSNEQEKRREIVREAREMIQRGRAVLVATPDIRSNREIAEMLSEHGISVISLDGTQDASEAQMIAAAGRRHAVTVATNVAGRGTDIALEKSVAEAGGLHVIVSHVSPCRRVDRQIIGRAARCGDAGSYRVFLSASDHISAIHAPWIGRSILRTRSRQAQNDDSKRWLDSLEQHVVAAQKKSEIEASANRILLFEKDRKRDSILSSAFDNGAGESRDSTASNRVRELAGWSG